MPTVLTPSALKELESLLSTSRRSTAEIYREWKAGLDPQAMAEARGHEDLKKVKESLSALRVLFGREPLPKRGQGRQQALNEASHWLHSDSYLSAELQEHFESLLHKGEKTNTRRKDLYDPLVPPTSRSVYRQGAEATAAGDEPGIYVITRKSFLEESEARNQAPLVKIGWSHKVWDRISGAQTWDPDPIVVLRIYPTPTPNVLEARIHICLDTLGLGYEGGGGREWFKASLPLLDELAKSLGLEPQDLSTDRQM